jgi:uncharacterized integral membrane protein
MDRAKALGMILLTAAVIFFAAQNLDSVQVEFLFWTFSVPLSLITLFPLLIGLVIGTAGTAVVIKRRERKAVADGEPAGAQVEPAEAEPGLLQEPPVDTGYEAEVTDDEEAAK